MLQLPNLDDQSFEQIVNDARKSIPKLIPQWTDENAHDPGITFIELFAWLAEMQQYYLNRITVRNEIKFLKLLGVELKEPESAQTDVTFENIAEPVFLPMGTKILAKDQPFETEHPILLIPNKIKKIIVRTDSASNDFTSSNENMGAAYYAFGPDAKRDSRLYIGFDLELPSGEPISINMNLFEEYVVERNRFSAGETMLTPSAKISWKYYGVEDVSTDQLPDWIPLNIIEDDTLHLSQSGNVIFTVSSPMEPLIIHPANDNRRYWICCTVEEEGYELSPKVEKVSVNTVSARQQDTLSQYHSYHGTAERGQMHEVNDYISYYGKTQVQIQEEDGSWRYWEEVADMKTALKEQRCFTLFKEGQTMKTRVAFGDGEHGAIPPSGKGNIRIISFMPSFSTERFLGRSTGLPNQVFKIDIANITASSLMIQAGKEEVPGGRELIWQDWLRVADFDNSKPGDRHYVFNAETSEIVFGNNEGGLIPNKSESYNLCILSFQSGGGERGNVKNLILNRILGTREELRKVTVSNYFFAVGGTERETVENAKLRVHKELKKQYRAVTSHDFEEITRATPGLRVARVKALPLYRPKLKDYPVNKAPAQMTVVVVPHSETQKPIPSKGFLETIGRHLDRHRLITTEVHIIPPEYIKITVYAVVIVEPHMKNGNHKINEVLDALLQPLDGKKGVKGWEFGRTVYKGDIYGVINKVKGIAYIQDLWLEAEGTDIQKSDNGDIQIPPYGLVYSGDHQITIISRNDI